MKSLLERDPFVVMEMENQMQVSLPFLPFSFLFHEVLFVQLRCFCLIRFFFFLRFSHVNTGLEHFNWESLLLLLFLLLLHVAHATQISFTTFSRKERIDVLCARMYPHLFLLFSSLLARFLSNLFWIVSHGWKVFMTNSLYNTSKESDRRYERVMS